MPSWRHILIYIIVKHLIDFRILYYLDQKHYLKIKEFWRGKWKIKN